MAKLKPGAVSIDLETGGIYGDIDHCPQADLLESAEALLSLLPRVRHKGLWGLVKDFDADCYLYTRAKGYKVPDDVRLEADIYRGTGGLPASRRPFKLIVMPERDGEQYWRSTWYEPLVGSVRNGKVSPDIEGVPDLTAEGRAEFEKARMREAMKPRQLKLEV